MDELKLNEVVVAKRHKELLSALKAIYDQLSLPADDTVNVDIKKAINSLEKAVKQPSNVEVVKELKALSSVLTESLENLKPTEVKDWTLYINRDSRGFIESVHAKKNI